MAQSQSGRQYLQTPSTRPAPRHLGCHFLCGQNGVSVANVARRICAVANRILPPVYYYFRTWKKHSVIERLLSVARRGARREAGREPEPSAVNEEFLVIDCQSVPITRSGGLCGFDGNKKVKGRKRHIVTDTQGWIRRAGYGRSRFMLRTTTRASTRSVFSKRPTRTRNGSQPSSPTRPIAATLKMSLTRRSGFSWRSLRRSRTSRAFQSSRSVGLSNARSAGSEAGGGSQKSTSDWSRPAKQWSGSHRYDWPSAASNGISKQVLSPLKQIIGTQIRWDRRGRPYSKKQIIE